MSTPKIQLLNPPLDRKAVFEEYKTANILDPTNAESGYYDAITLAPTASANHLRTITPISVEGHSNLYVRTNCYTNNSLSDALICIILYDREGNKVSYTTRRHQFELPPVELINTVTHMHVWISGVNYGASFDNVCLSFEDTGFFVEYGEGERIKESDIVLTTPPEKGTDPIPKGYFDDALYGKLNANNERAYSVYVTGTAGVQTMRSLSAFGSIGSNMAVPYFAAPNSSQFPDDAVVTHTIGVCDPVKGYQAANKQYVDNKTRDLEQGVYNALGAMYKTVVDTSTDFAFNLPSTAMRFICVEDFGMAYCFNTTDGELGAVSIDLMYIGGEGNNYLQRAHLPAIIELPDGESLMPEIIPLDGTEWTEIRGRKIIYQEKVGG